MRHLVAITALALAATVYAQAGESGGANPGSTTRGSGINRPLDMAGPGDSDFDRPGGAGIPDERSIPLPSDHGLHPNRAGDAPDVPDVDETDPTTPGRELRNKPTNEMPPDVNDSGIDNPAGPGTMR
jgi:hypothetical protein